MEIGLFCVALILFLIHITYLMKMYSETGKKSYCIAATIEILIIASFAVVVFLKLGNSAFIKR